jgi:chromosome segregation ATPase
MARRVIDEKSTAFTHYRRLLTELAQDADLDVDEVQAAIILQAAGKTTADLAADLEVMRQRLSWSRQLSERSRHQEELAKAKAEHAKATAELNEANARLRPAIDAAYSRMKILEKLLTHCSFAEHELTQSCLDPAVVAAEKSLLDERQELQAKFADANQEVEKHRNLHRLAESHIEEMSRRLEKLPSGDAVAIGDLKRRLAEQKTEKANRAEKLDAATSEARPIQQRLQAIEAELADLRQKKLTP